MMELHADEAMTVRLSYQLKEKRTGPASRPAPFSQSAVLMGGSSPPVAGGAIVHRGLSARSSHATSLRTS